LRKKIISTESETDINKALQQVNIKSTEEVSRWSEFAATRPLERDFIIAQTVHLCLDNNMECKTNSTVDLFGEPFYTLDVSFVDEDADPDDYPGAAVEALLDELSEEKRIPFNFRYQLIDARINPETNQIEGSIMPVPPEDWQSLFSSDD